MLKRIYIHNYRTFVNFEWSPPMACVLVGENGSGKSSFMDVLVALRLLLIFGRSVIELDFASVRTQWLKESDQKLELELEDEGESFRYLLTHRSDGGHSSIREELYRDGVLVYRSRDGKVELLGDGEASPPVVIPYDRHRSFISALEPQDNNRQIVKFRDSLESILTIRPDPMSFHEVSKQESARLTVDLSNFADWYRTKVGQDPEAAVQVMNDLRESVTGFVQLRLEPVSAEHKELRVRFKFGSKSHELGWSKLSAGQRLLIALYGMFRLGLSRRTVQILDEIENYVAPKEIQPFLRKLLDASAEAGKQVIVISHHPESINYLAADSIWRMWRDPVGGHTRIAKVEVDLDSGETAYDLVKRGEPDA